VLGGACAAASFGAWIAVTGCIEPAAFVIAAANAAWVAGFDVIYAIQDIKFDRTEGLFSIPAVFGARTARLAAVLMHTAAAALLLATAELNSLGPLFYAGVAVIAALFAVEHIIAAPGLVKKDSRLINFAAYNMNQIIGLTLIIFTALNFIFE
jgi:4-hydroxybenzoate polyprenyltransferase